MNHKTTLEAPDGVSDGPLLELGKEPILERLNNPQRDPYTYISLGEALRRGIEIKMPGWEKPSVFGEKPKKKRKGQRWGRSKNVSRGAEPFKRNPPPSRNNENRS